LQVLAENSKGASKLSLMICQSVVEKQYDLRKFNGWQHLTLKFEKALMNKPTVARLAARELSNSRWEQEAHED